MEILIIGAGLGGLTLANVLRQADATIQIRIVERDAGPESRVQGGTLSLKDPGGLVALRRLGMDEDMRLVSLPVTDLTLLTAQGHRLLTVHEPPPPRQTTWRVPRAWLRTRLLHDVRDLISFGMTCTGYETHADRPSAQFADGQQIAADLLVACDGVKSVVRQQMFGDHPHYLGLAAITGSVPSVSRHPLLAHGPILVIGNGASLFVDQDQDSIGWSLTVQAAREEFDQLAGTALQPRVVAVTRNWYAPIAELVRSTEASHITFLGGFYDRHPLAHAHRNGIVLLGDAAHPMSPFRGEGANMAMVDALSLADATQLDGLAEREQVLVRYEQEMLPRSRKAVLLSRNAAREMHSRNWITQRIRTMKFHLADHFMAHG